MFHWSSESSGITPAAFRFLIRTFSLWTMSTERGRSSLLSSSGGEPTERCTVSETEKRTTDLLPKRCSKRQECLYFTTLSVWMCIIRDVPFRLSPFICSQIPLKNFNSGEVSTWSALKSPRVVELFGVVREGPYIHLLMEYKSGKSFLPRCVLPPAWALLKSTALRVTLMVLVTF